METEERTIQDLLTNEIADKIEKLGSIEPGTEKHSRLCDDISKLYRLQIENYKVECEIFNQSQRIENDKARDEAELALKKLQIERESSRFGKIKPDTVLSLSAIVGLTIGTCIYESKGYIFPAKLLQHVPKLKLFV